MKEALSGFEGTAAGNLRHWGTSVSLAPLVVATVVSLALYYPQAALLLFKLGQVFNGVFDTSVPAFPLAGMFFVMMFISLRRNELLTLLTDRKWSPVAAATGIAFAVLPLVAILATGSELSGSYSFAGVALAMCWFGVLLAMRPSVFGFLWPYLLAFLLAVGSVGILTTDFGDPLAVVVAAISKAITTALRLPVTWTSVYMSFSAAGGYPITLYISQECSGMASMAIFLLLIAMMHLDIRPSILVSVLFSVGGSLMFILLNSIRVVILIIGGIYYGENVLWNLHGWVGYVLYIAGYSLLVVGYISARSWRTQVLDPKGEKPQRDSPRQANRVEAERFTKG